ncbi:transposase [Streptomyces griseorubiginosus]|uniref:IS701 family transposase n=1 Tax=Streptomyces griseorubiginosus TaxID=67304 RepID=UPI0036EA02A5
MTDISELYASLFTDFRGATHRVRARQYVEGLLGVDGRKTVANIAAAVGDPQDEQRLRRFVSGAAWPWDLLRRALARTVTTRAGEGAGAWVVLPVSIPKNGDRSVGVTRHYCPERERVVVGQQAFGAWFATQERLVPISWRLLRGSSETDRVAAVRELVTEVAEWTGDRRPVVVDPGALPVTDPARQPWERCPLMVRVDAGVGLAVDPQVFPGHAAAPVASASQALKSVGRLSAASRGVATVPAALAAGGPGPLTALGVWPGGRVSGKPEEVWLSDVPAARPASLGALARLPRRVAGGWRTRGAAVGLADFEGRSLPGWHRHMTLASCAYAVDELAGAQPERQRSVLCAA